MNVCDADVLAVNLFCLLLQTETQCSDYTTVMCKDCEYTGSLYRLRLLTALACRRTDKRIEGRMWIPSESVSPRSRVSHSIVNEHSDSCDTVLDKCSCERV